MDSNQTFVVKESRIPGAGRGLFTNAPLKRGEYIIEYRGRRRKWSAVKDDHGNAYIFYVDENFVIDGRDDETSLGRYANDANGLQRIKGLRNNARFLTERNRVYIQATRGIPAGAEILVSYGRAYWNTVRKNREIDALEGVTNDAPAV